MLPFFNLIPPSPSTVIVLTLSIVSCSSILIVLFVSVSKDILILFPADKCKGSDPIGERFVKVPISPSSADIFIVVHKLAVLFTFFTNIFPLADLSNSKP